jgi:hypothetical protein
MLKMNRTAEIALKALSPGDRNLVNHALSRLRNQTGTGKSYRSFGRTGVKALSGGLYLSTIQQRFGIIFREVEGNLVVLDILPSGRLNAIYGPQGLAHTG